MGVEPSGTIRHDIMRDAMVDTMRFYGVKDVRKEPSSLLVSNLSAPVLAQMQLDYARQNKRFMEGVRPDFSACVPPSGQHTVDPSLAIFDVKVHSVCKTHYPPRFQSQNQSVEAHVASVKSEYSQKHLTKANIRKSWVPSTQSIMLVRLGLGLSLARTTRLGR